MSNLVERLRARAASENEGGDEAAAERAMMGMEAKSDIWAERVNLNGLISNLVHVNRLSPNAPNDVREKFIKRQFEQIDALMRQAYLEGYLEGGLSRKSYDVDLDLSTADRIEALERERDEAQLNAAVIEGISNELDIALTASQAEVTRLKEALKPFAELLDKSIRTAEMIGFNHEAKPDDQVCLSVGVGQLVLGDFRRARSVLEEQKP